MCTRNVHRPYNMQDKAGHLTITQLSGRKPTMFASSAQVVACNATTSRVCTLVSEVEKSFFDIVCCVFLLWQ